MKVLNLVIGTETQVFPLRGFPDEDEFADAHGLDKLLVEKEALETIRVEIEVVCHSILILILFNLLRRKHLRH